MFSNLFFSKRYFSFIDGEKRGMTGGLLKCSINEYFDNLMFEDLFISKNIISLHNFLIMDLDQITSKLIVHALACY